MKRKIIEPFENEDGEILLLEKGKRGLLRVIFGRTTVVTLLMLAQLAVLLELPGYLGAHFPIFYPIFSVFSVIVGLQILNTDIDPTIKITWLTLVMLLPVFGTALYLYIHNDVGHRTLKARMEAIMQNTADSLAGKPNAQEQLETEAPPLQQLSNYLSQTGPYPVYKNTSVQYFPVGEEQFAVLLTELSQAKKFIFLEYFIIDEGYMWGRVLEILARKAQEGLEVRVMYDGSCEFTTLPYAYPQKLRELGIKCKAFAPIMPFVSTTYNYRDHRKILVIDGHTAFTGGINLADEYINRKKRFGHWKDTGVMLKGEAVPSFTLMFLQMWHVDEDGPHDLSWLDYPTLPPQGAQGYVLPYGDCPLDDYRAGEMVYYDMLCRAKQYIYFMTPYLILDGEMETALKFAAQRGVDVRLILPHIPDKKIPYALAKTHYAALLRAGVKIYEYLPGFIHAKTVLCDDICGVVGTINLDYRSFYHHFECAVYLEGVPALADIRRDFEQTLGKCKCVTQEDVKHEKLGVRLTGACFRIFAPLM